MPTELCVFLILYILWYNNNYCTCIIITKYGCVFLKLGGSIYIRGNGSHSHTLLGSLPLAHMAIMLTVNYGTRPDTVRYAVLGH